MKHFFSIFIVFSIFFIACKREEIEPVNHNESPITEINDTTDLPNYDHFNGNFYCSRDYVYSYSDQAVFTNNIESDRVVKFEVLNDSIFYNNSDHGIPIDSVNQTHFTASTDPNNPNSSFYFTYSNDFNSIIINQTFSAEASPYINTTYNGERSDLLMTDNPHPYSNEIEGEYLLTRTYWDSETNLEIIETDTFLISIDGSNILIDDEEYYMGTYVHSYCELYDYSSLGLPHYTEREFNVTWQNDFELYQYFIDNSESIESPDTTEVHYIGGPL